MLLLLFCGLHEHDPFGDLTIISTSAVTDDSAIIEWELLKR